MELPCDNCGGELVEQGAGSGEWMCLECGEWYDDEELDVLED